MDISEQAMVEEELKSIAKGLCWAQQNSRKQAEWMRTIVRETLLDTRSLKQWARKQMLDGKESNIVDK